MQKKRGRKSSAELATLRPVPTPLPKRSPSHPAPFHLQPETKVWWDAVCMEYALEEHHRRILQAACEAWDRFQQARAAIAEHGLTYNDQNGCPRPRPEVGIERDSRLAFARLVASSTSMFRRRAMIGFGRRL